MFELLATALFIFLAASVVLGAIKIVPQGVESTVERFGRYTRTLEARHQLPDPLRRGHWSKDRI